MGSGYGNGGCGNGGCSCYGSGSSYMCDAGGGGGAGALVLAIMDGGTFNITVGQGGKPSSGLEYGCPACATGLPGVVYLIPLP